LLLSWIVSVPSRRETTLRQVSVDFTKLREPVVVTHEMASLPTLVPAASVSGLVKASTAPCRLSRPNLVFVVRMWVDVEPFSSCLNVRLRVPGSCTEALAKGDGQPGRSQEGDSHGESHRVPQSM